MNNNQDFNREISTEYLLQLAMRLSPENKKKLLEAVRALAGKPDERASA